MLIVITASTKENYISVYTVMSGSLESSVHINLLLAALLKKKIDFVLPALANYLDGFMQRVFRQRNVYKREAMNKEAFEKFWKEYTFDSNNIFVKADCITAWQACEKATAERLLEIINYYENVHFKSEATTLVLAATKISIEKVFLTGEKKR
jgi:hypothetical protein